MTHNERICIVISFLFLRSLASISLRIPWEYKSKEKEWFYDLWRVAKDAETGEPLWDGEEEVWRVEMRFKRPALNEMKGENFHGIDDAFDLEEHLPGLWSEVEWTWSARLFMFSSMKL